MAKQASKPTFLRAPPKSDKEQDDEREGKTGLENNKKIGEGAIDERCGQQESTRTRNKIFAFLLYNPK